MTTPVEARSLSSLTHLFANPPQYPRNPTHNVHTPLVLYIVRVPGSQDVFLSPVKPPTKASISLEAVQSSLYYFHVKADEDEEVRQSAERQRKSEESARPLVRVSRKPVPPTLANHPLPAPPAEETPYQPCRPREFGRGSYQGIASERGALLKVDTSTDSQIHRKPVTLKQPTTLYNAAGDYATSPALHERQRFADSDHAQPRETKVELQDLSHPDYSHSSLSGHGDLPRQAAYPYTSASAEVAPIVDTGFRPVTIIRRDPSTGSQWNIGTISLLTSTFPGSKMKPVCVELNTPGYGRFARNVGFETPRPMSASSDAASIRRAIQSATISPATPDTPGISFCRVVDFRKMALSDLRRTAYQRTNSSDSIGKTEGSKSGIEKNALAFDSPWQGTCTFINGIDGKTLKIKHTLNGNSYSGEGVTANVAELRFNLGWSILSNVKDTRRKKNEQEPEKLPIPKLIESKKENLQKSFQHLRTKSRESFLRSRSSNKNDEDVLRDLSNIQTSTTNNLNDRGYSTISTPSGDSIYNKHNDLPRSYSSANPTSSEENEDEQHRLSLKLGRERAGGGFRGQSAKLGKLIIEDEGLKMCDLVVAAAMGVWWQHYGG